jgi:thiol-disulfide isomerase/thioredoxin
MRYLITLLLCLGSVFAQAQAELTLKDIDGKSHNLSEYRGKIVVLNFWATWCIPCKDEMPIFSEADRQYRPRGVVVLAASLDDAKTRKYVEKFAHAYKMNFTILMDATSANMRQLGLGESIPSTIFFDENGNPVAKIKGQAHKKDVFSNIEQLLNHTSEVGAKAGKPSPS